MFCRAAKVGQGGYTLVEMLLVLLISSTLLMVTAFSILPFQHTIGKKSFKMLLESDIYRLQSHAVNQQETVILQFYPYAGKYAGRVMGGESLFSRELPEGISQIPNSSLSSITIYPDGNTNKFGTIYYMSGENMIKLTFQIGQGRFHVEE